MKNLILVLVMSLSFIACAKNQVNTTKENKMEKEEVVVSEPVKLEPVVKKVKPKKLKGIYYKMITKSIEVFPYKGKLKSLAVLDDTKLGKPFYIKGRLVRIEKIYDSKIGDKYGKISGKNLLVSMDDLVKK